jgi:catechol 2,3-dioxygenase-like lactoylglutathione lyase family enzyme
MRDSFMPAPSPTLRRRFDHIDLRVPSLAVARPFYAVLLPALGFSKDVSDGAWFQFEAESASGVAEFFGITESRGHVPNETRIAFWADSTGEVDRLAKIVRRAGGRNIEGPGEDEGPGYYAVFFEDPCGNRLEICHRLPADKTKGNDL